MSETIVRRVPAMGTVFYVCSNPFKQQRCCQFLVLLSSVEIPGKWSHLFKCFFFQHKLTKPHGILQGLRYVGGAFWSSWLLEIFSFFPWYSKHLWAFRVEPNRHQSENAQVLHRRGSQQGVPYLSHTESIYGIFIYIYIWLIFVGKDIYQFHGWAMGMFHVPNRSSFFRKRRGLPRRWSLNKTTISLFSAGWRVFFFPP